MEPGRSPSYTRPLPRLYSAEARVSRDRYRERYLLAKAKDGPLPRSDRQTWPKPKLPLAEAKFLLGRSPSIKVPIPGTVSPGRSPRRTSPEIGPANLAEAQVTTGRSLSSTRPKPEYRGTDIGNGLLWQKPKMGPFPRSDRQTWPKPDSYVILPGWRLTYLESLSLVPVIFSRQQGEYGPLPELKLYSIGQIPIISPSTSIWISTLIWVVKNNNAII